MKMDCLKNININMKIKPVSIDDIYQVSQLLNVDFDELNRRFLNRQKGYCLYESENGELLFRGAMLFNEAELEEIKCINNGYKELVKKLPKTVYKAKVLESESELVNALKSVGFIKKNEIIKEEGVFLLIERPSNVNKNN